MCIRDRYYTLWSCGRFQEKLRETKNNGDGLLEEELVYKKDRGLRNKISRE